MNATRLAVFGLALVVLTSTAAGLPNSGGTAAGLPNGGDTATGPSNGGDAASSGGPDGSTDTLPADAFDFDLQRLERCGRTCRDVTLTLTNQQATAATNVTVASRLYVGSGTGGYVAWRGSKDVGTIAPGASVTTTTRVKLSYLEAFAIRQRGGWITVATTVHTADGSVTDIERRNVL